MPLMKSTGLLPRLSGKREEMRTYASGPAFPVATVVQRIHVIHHQQAKPSCVGHALAACVEAKEGRRVSAVDLWVDARRRQGDLEGVLDGTRAEYAIESLVARGVSPYVQGEDSRSTSEDDDLPSLDQELAATDNRLRVTHRTIAGARSDKVIQALLQGHGVVFGTGVSERYNSPPPGVVLGPGYLGGEDNGHEQRIAGYDSKRDAFLVQNSWGQGWGGCVIDGVSLPGCVLVSRAVIESAWDVDVLIMESE